MKTIHFPTPPTGVQFKGFEEVSKLVLKERMKKGATFKGFIQGRSVATSGEKKTWEEMEQWLKDFESLNLNTPEKPITRIYAQQ